MSARAGFNARVVAPSGVQRNPQRNEPYRLRLRELPPLPLYHWLLVQLVLIEEFALHCSHE
jgi:hypothetical protein